MSATRPALSAAGCSHCRSRMLGLFIGSAPRPVPAVRSPLQTYARTSPVIRVFPVPVRGFSSLSDPNSPAPNADYGYDSRASEEVPEIDDDGAAPGPAKKADDVPWYLQVEPPTHVAQMAPQPLPEVPPGSPDIIGSLLEYASEEIGLDDLSLLDLRKLDPPPALGSNLFMLFGTARSERHLHVSAGRLVRWLRANHRVHATADGLLGPNERKTKLRRKAKRAKLLGTTGNDDMDDGIRTGWICVNLGTISRGGPESEIIGEDGRVSGFGVSHSGFTIVFQIMVESRRAELALETLWMGVLERSLNPPSKSNATLENKSPTQRAKPEHKLDEVESAILSGLHRPSISRGGRRGRGSGSSLLSSQASFYSTQSPSTASSVFLELMELAMRTLSPTETWPYRLAVQHKAMNDLRSFVEELRMYGIQPTRAQYLQLLSCLFHSKRVQSNTLIELGLDVISAMHGRINPSWRVTSIVTIMEAVSKGADDKLWAASLVEKLEMLTFLPTSRYMGETLLMRLVTVHAKEKRWSRVLNAWGVPPRYLRPQSSTLSGHILGLAAASGSATTCAPVLRRCFSTMSQEMPPVYSLGEVRQAILKCIDLIDPNAQLLARETEGDERGPIGLLARQELVRIALMIKDIR
ncbi:hypothetical protein GGR50DRAFT_703463 [Xylaria sp. CBS 124048]|nr:hypothetical protein GGR50DRAFT_703463 [Xylaria sp. CBS 124048]